MPAAAAAAAVTSSSRTEPPGLDNGFHPGAGQHLQPVREREEGIRSRHRATHPVPAPLDGKPRGVDPVDLPHADTDGGPTSAATTIAFDFTPPGRPARRTPGR